MGSVLRSAVRAKTSLVVHLLKTCCVQTSGVERVPGQEGEGEYEWKWQVMMGLFSASGGQEEDSLGGFAVRTGLVVTLHAL